MLVFSGPTKVEQVVGVIDGRPHPIQIVNAGDAPVEVLDILLDADWATYGLLVTDTSDTGGKTPASASPLPASPPMVEKQLYQLQFESKHVVLPGPEHAWRLNLYWDATHPDARPGPVSLKMSLRTGDKTETRELTFQTSLKHLPVFEGLFSLDWGDANLRGAYVAREAFNPKPVPVLVGDDAPTPNHSSRRKSGSAATNSGSRSGLHALSAPPSHTNTSAGHGTAVRAGSLGTRATLYLDNVQDKFAPIVSVDEQAELQALVAAPSHLPNLVRNLKRTLVTLPPYGGLTVGYLEGQQAIIEDRFSANAFRAQSYDVTQLARLLIETTVASLAQSPRRMWDEDGDRLLTLPEPIGIVNEVVLTYPPLMPAPVRRALRQWFRDGGVALTASREWDEVTARVLHAALGFLHDRGGKLETFVRRFGRRNEFLLVDIGATASRLARVRLDMVLGEPADTHTATAYRSAGLRVVHHATAVSYTFTGERLLLSVFRLLKLKMAALLASRLAALPPTPSANGSADARAAAQELNAAIQAGRIGDLLAQPLEHLPPVVERLIPTQFRDRIDEAPRRHFTLLTLLAARVLESFVAGDEQWTPRSESAGRSLLPFISEAMAKRFPELRLSDEDWGTLIVRADDVRTQIRPAIRALGRAVRRLMQAPIRKSDAPDTDASTAEKAAADAEPSYRPAPLPASKRRLTFAKGWPDTEPKTGSAAPAPPTSAGPVASAIPSDEIDVADELLDPWVLLGGGTVVPELVREMLVTELTLRDDDGAGHQAPKLWPYPAEPATAVALGACEAESAVQSGLRIEVEDSLQTLQFDIGIRTDRFVSLLGRGLPVRQASHAELPLTPSLPVMIWYRFTEGPDPAALLGSFDRLPPGDGPLLVNLVPRGDGAWTLELTRSTPYRPDNPAESPSVSLTPARPLMPLEHNLYSGIH